MIPLVYLSLCLCLILSIPASLANVDPIEGRYSFSLTTFHPSGKLPQLEHAIKASILGPPIIAISLPNNKGILLTSIQSLPSPLINDDGTSRFVKVSKSIVVGHTGVNADGRVLCEAAQRLSVEHTYTFHEEIPVDVLLEEMSLLFQEYTMKPGCRPFGSSLVVASLNDSDHEGECSLFRIDPAGTVTKMDSMGYAGRGDGDGMIKKLIDAGCMNAIDIEEAEEVMMNVLRDEIIGSGIKSKNYNGSLDKERISSSSIISAKLRSPSYVKITRTKV
jgi:20S proteasome alpha/beta subunit